MNSYLQPIDKQSFLDSGILCCLIHVLIALLAPGGDSNFKKPNENEDNENNDAEIRPVRQLEVPFYFNNADITSFCSWFNFPMFYATLLEKLRCGCSSGRYSPAPPYYQFPLELNHMYSI